MRTQPLPTRHRIDVDAYYRMADAGILTADQRVELIEGDIVDMVPIGSHHAGVTGRLNRGFDPARLHGRALVSVQSPLRIDRYSEPQPDLMLLRPRGDDYVTAHPTPADVLLVVEVANSSLGYDRTTKALLYAKAGVPELWIVDLGGAEVEVCRGPAAEGYGERMLQRSGLLCPTALPEASIDLDDLLRGLPSRG